MTRLTCLLIAACIGVSACGRSEPVDPLAEPVVPSTDAAATSQTPDPVHVALAPTAGHTAAGMLMIAETDDGVSIEGRITGLEPDSELGFHIHEVGDCSAPDASSAGEHFNPTGQSHGDPDSDARHLGDMVNLDVDGDGEATVDITVEDVTLYGASDRSIRNRAVVVHAATDDYETQPSGGSGARIACGVIGGDGMTDDVPVPPNVPGVMQTPGAGEPPAVPQP